MMMSGEVSPKSIAKESPETIAKFSAPFLHILMIMLTPVTFLFSQWKKLLSRIFKSSENHGITDEELMTIVEEATQEGDIDDQEGDLIQNAIGFMEMEAAEIFTPRVNVIGIPLDAPRSLIKSTVARELSPMLTMLLPTRIVESSLSKFSSNFNTSSARLSPFSAIFFMRMRFSEVKEVSVAFK